MYVQRPDERRYDQRQAAFAHSPTGTGYASVLPMTDDEKAAVDPRPIGFAPAPTPKRRRRRKPPA